MGLFRLILIFIIVYTVFKLVSAIFKPKPRNSNRNSYHYRDKRKEGDVSININKQPDKKRVPKDEGDYIDFEDV